VRDRASVFQFINMKTLTSILLVAVMAILPACAAPLPTRATTLTLSWDAAPRAGLQTVIHYALPADAAWQTITNAEGVTSCTFTNPAYGLVFYATFYDPVMGLESQPSDAVTNNILFAGPTTLSILKK